VERALTWQGANAEGVSDELLRLASTHHLDGWVLIPAGDSEVRLLAEHRDALTKVFRSTVPGLDVIRWADDKNLTYEKAQALGLPTPTSSFKR